MKAFEERLFRYVTAILFVVISFIAVRLFEYLYIHITSTNDLSVEILLKRSISGDLLVIITTYAYLALPILLVGFISERLADYLMWISGILLALANILLTGYYLTSHCLLGGEILEFSISDVIGIVSSEISAKRMVLLVTMIALSIIPTLLMYVSRVKFKHSKWIGRVLVTVIVTFSVCCMLNGPVTLKSIVNFDNKFQYFLGNSKLLYLWQSIIVDVNDHAGLTLEEVEEAIDRYHERLDWFNFVSKEFPFVHNEPYENVLGSFFISDSIRPNVVIIISESLSATFSGSTQVIGKKSLTPFTDSLANSGLSWSTFFSNAERSYGALPNILSSLPYGVGTRGFINNDLTYKNMRNYPNHSGLIEILKNNGYVSHYFYGGWGGFDNVDRYLKELDIDHFVCMDDFEKDKYLFPKDGWWYNDKDLYQKSLDDLDVVAEGTPFLAIFQTVSFHSPFNMAESRYYEAEYLNSKFQQLGYTSADRPNLSLDVISSIFFADDALATLFAQLKKHPSYNETIFIVTGDHSIDLNLSNHSFENFHVPLIIYSPLLNTSSQFRGACSHLDILPSLLGLLCGNYALNLPVEKHWIGQGLDTSRNSSFNRMIPFKLSSSDLPSFMFKDTVQFAGSYWKVDSTLHLTGLENVDKCEIETLIKDYWSINDYVCREDKIWESTDQSMLWESCY